MTQTTTINTTDVSYNDIKCGGIHVTPSLIGLTLLHSQSNFV